MWFMLAIRLNTCITNICLYFRQFLCLGSGCDSSASFKVVWIVISASVSTKIFQFLVQKCLETVLSFWKNRNFYFFNLTKMKSADVLPSRLRRTQVCMIYKLSASNGFDWRSSGVYNSTRVDYNNAGSRPRASNFHISFPIRCLFAVAGDPKHASVGYRSIIKTCL